MRCHKAQQRIEALGADGDKVFADKELLEHIRSCPECASLIQAEDLLKRDFKAATNEEITNEIPFAILKMKVEATADLVTGNGGRVSKEKGIMAKYLRKPRYSISLAAVVVVVLAATFFPFSFENKLGYEVAIAGVDENLALDEDRVCELLYAVGIEECDFEVGDCDETCNLMIRSLKDQDEVKVVCAAFGEMGNCEIKKIIEIDEKGEKDHIITELSDGDDSKIKIFVKQRLEHLEELHEGEFNIWITSGECDSGTNVIFYPDDEDFEESEYYTYDGNHLDHFELDKADMQQVMVKVVTLDDGSEMAIIEKDGETHEVDLNADDAEEQLKALGLDAETVAMCHGDFATKVYVGGEGNIIGNELKCRKLTFDTLPADWTPDAMSKKVMCSGDRGEFLIEATEDDSGQVLCLLTSPDGKIIRFDPSNEDDLKKLEEMGYRIKIKDNCIFTGRKDEKFADEADEGTEAASETSVRFGSHLPDEFQLRQNYPNPFNPFTTVIYSLPQAEMVTLEVFNMNGQRVRTLVDEYQEAGDHSVVWDSMDDNGKKVASGVYLYKITAGDFTDSKKMTLMK